jgi:predicted TIM-barrel fold metal-dependent hydrolase
MARVVDAHMHIWRAIPAGEPAPRAIVGPHEDVPAERALEVMDRHGVDRAVLVQPVFRGEDNSDVVQAATDYPDRFAAVCVVDPRIPEAEERLEYWTVERGCRGLRLRPRILAEAPVFGEPSTFPLWEQARRLGVVVSVLAATEHLATLGRLAARFPEVPIVIDHLAHPKVEEGTGGAGFRQLLAMAHHPNVYVKISGYYHFTEQPDPFPDCWPLLEALHDHFQPHRLIWGSDFPHGDRVVGYARGLELVMRDLPFLSDAARALILGGNAARLYWASG